MHDRPGRGRLPRRVAGFLAGIVSGALPLAAAAQSPGDPLFLVGQATGGGGRSSGGSYALAGSIAVPLCAVSAGGSYVLNGGLVGAYVVPTPGVVLHITWGGPFAQLDWSPDALETGYVLESSPEIGPGAVWQPVVPTPVIPSLVVPAEPPARFYRLRKP